MDNTFCVAIYLQFVLEFQNTSHSNYLFCDSNETPEAVKKPVGVTLNQRVLQSDDWAVHQANLEGAGGGSAGLLETHSLRKLGSSYFGLADGKVSDDITCKVAGRIRSVSLIGTPP
jgi:hypothetical protein